MAAPLKKYKILLISILLFPLYSMLNNPAKSTKENEKKEEEHNIILITIDTLRNDYLNSSGNHTQYTPNIDKLAKRGVQFYTTFNQIPYTVPSLSSIFTSSPPMIHGVYTNNYTLRETPYFLTKILNNHEYKTQAIISGLAKISTGLNQGFDGYKDNTSGDNRKMRREAKPLVGLGKDYNSFTMTRGEEGFINAEICSENACAWLEKNYQKKFFLWIHIWEPHQPYIPPEKYLRIYEDKYEGVEYQYFHEFEKIRKYRTLLLLEVLNHVKNLYSAEVTYTDSQIGRVIRKVVELGILGNTLVVFTADHGEELYEHKYLIGHGRYLYEPSMRIPLIFLSNALPPKDFIQPVESMDISPTILSFLNIPVPEKMMGRNLLPLIKGDNFKNKEYFIGETEERRFSIYDGEWKLLSEKKIMPELYNIQVDPGERSNLFESEQKKGLDLNNKLQSWISKYSKEPPVVQINKDPDMREKLKALGYIN